MKAPEELRVASHAPLRAPECLAGILTPSKGLSVVWVCVVLILGLAVRNTEALAGFLLGTFLVGLGSMLVVTALMPPPPRFTETSALAARLFSFLKATWAAFVFTAAAVYGGVVGVSLTSSTDWQTSTAGFDSLQQFIWPVVGYVAAVAGIYSTIACAVDLHRAGTAARADAIDRVMRPVESLIGASRPTNWLRDFLQLWVEGWRPWALVALAPLVAPSVWTYLALLS